MHFNVDALKEPKGFMKVLQFVFAILAFATTTSFSTDFSFHATPVGCNGTINDLVHQHVTYPFQLDHITISQQVCSKPAVIAKFHLQTNTSSDAEFFVAIGVICTIYSLALLAVYSFYSEGYSQSNVLPTFDLVMHGLFAVFWLAASSAWADGVGTLKSGCNPAIWLDQVCNDQVNVNCQFLPGDSSGSFPKLHISLLFGFLNMFLWASNMWFLYKETPYFRGNQAPTSVEGGNIGNI